MGPLKFFVLQRKDEWCPLKFPGSKTNLSATAIRGISQTQNPEKKLFLATSAIHRENGVLHPSLKKKLWQAATTHLHFTLCTKFAK